MRPGRVVPGPQGLGASPPARPAPLITPCHWQVQHRPRGAGDPAAAGAGRVRLARAAGRWRPTSPKTASRCTPYDQPHALAGHAARCSATCPALSHGPGDRPRDVTRLDARSTDLGDPQARPAAPAAKRDADAALHPPLERRTRTARGPAARELVLGHRRGRADAADGAARSRPPARLSRWRPACATPRCATTATRHGRQAWQALDADACAATCCAGRSAARPCALTLCGDRVLAQTWT